MAAQEPRDIMSPAEVAAYFGVNVKTVTRWANAGKLESFRTLGGHRRFLRVDVVAAESELHDS